MCPDLKGEPAMDPARCAGMNLASVWRDSCPRLTPLDSMFCGFKKSLPVSRDWDSSGREAHGDQTASAAEVQDQVPPGQWAPPSQSHGCLRQSLLPCGTSLLSLQLPVWQSVSRASLDARWDPSTSARQGHPPRPRPAPKLQEA